MKNAGHVVVRTLVFLLLLVVSGAALGACQPTQADEGKVAPVAAPATTSTVGVATITTTPTTTPTQPATATTPAPATPTARPTATFLPPTATASPTATATATATPVACTERAPPDEELLVHVSRDYGLSRSYKPGDLVPVSDFFPNSVTLGYPTEVRERIIAPLQEIVAAMQAEGLRPLVISGFRSYSAQSLARQKWVEQYPEWAHNLSAPPGHSEHQLGTTVDFGSPELPDMVGEEHIQFHPAFAQSSEGKWLAEHAHRYGFTMSYPADRFEITAFYYEPWHFRYVGIELATFLKENDLTLTEFLLEMHPEPCIL